MNERKRNGKGIPLIDIERAMSHYGITEEEYLSHPECYPLPERGYGLTTGNEVPPECPSYVPFIITGLVMGGIIGTGFALILSKEQKA